MVNYHTELVNTLKTILPTHYELYLKNQAVPCISYMENNNAVIVQSSAQGYSDISYTIKVWADDIGTALEYAQQIDKALRPLGWKRTSTGELFGAGRVQKIMNYEATASEMF